jgi:uncharacterized coiled-coil DUF342 family protein
MYKEYLQKLENLKGGEKIDLGSVDDLKKLVDKSKKIIKEVSSLEKKVQSEQQSLRKAVSDYNKVAKNLDGFEKEKAPLHSKIVKLIDTIKKDAKALGIKPNSIEGIQEAYKIQEEMSRRSKFGMEADLMFVG